MSHAVAAPACPPGNIERTDDDAWRITAAAAGCAEVGITIESREGQLAISGK